MTAQLATMHDFIVKLMREVPRDIHPSAQQIIHEYYCEMRDAVDDPVEVWRSPSWCVTRWCSSSAS